MSTSHLIQVNDYTVGWVCALPTELAAARRMLDETYQDFYRILNDTNIYTLGRIGGHNVVVACLPCGQIGTNSAAAVAVQMKSTFPSIEFGLMVGIGGGVPSKERDIRLGDVVVSSPGSSHGGVVQYDSGKTTESGFKRTGFLNAPPALLLNATAKLAADCDKEETRLAQHLSKHDGWQDFLQEATESDILFEATYNHVIGDTCKYCDQKKVVERKPRSQSVMIHYGTIASGNQVMRNGTERDRVSSELGGVLCFEMESAGLMNNFPCLVIRGICDYADSHKNKIWQPFAAGMAAAYAKDLLSAVPPAEAPRCQVQAFRQYRTPRGHQQILSQTEEKINAVRSYKSFLGRLLVKVTKTNTPSEAIHSKVEKTEVTFLPPWWVSNTVVRVNVRNHLESFYAELVPEWTIRPVSVNQNPRLLKALVLCDINELKNLFRAKEVRPTDMVFDKVRNGPITLLEAILRAFVLPIIPCSTKLFKHKLLFQFLLDQGLQPSDQSIVAFFLSVNGSWAYDQSHSCETLVDAYFHSILAKGGCSLDLVKIPSRLCVLSGCTYLSFGPWDDEPHESILSVLIERVSGFKAAYDCLFHKSQVWTTEDLKMRSKWYIGILAHTDKTFRAALRDYFSSFKSPFNTASISMSDMVLQSVFDVKTIVELVKASPVQDRAIFLYTIIKKGTPQMLDPFLNVGIDLDEDYMMMNYLGTAATCKNLLAVDSLLDAGASPVRALPLLCDSTHMGILEFNSMFTTFMDSLTNAKGKIADEDFADPVLAVLQCTRAMDLLPDSVEILLKNGAFLHSRLYGSQKEFITRSYVLNSILFNRPTSLKSLLMYGVLPDSSIQDMFRTDPTSLKPLANYTWLTLAIELGRGACVKVLVDCSSNPTYLVKRQDAGGRCAISLARSFVAGPHPRASALYNLPWIVLGGKDEHTTSSLEDATIYDILQSALGVDSDEPPYDNPSRALTHIPTKEDFILELRSYRAKLCQISISEAFYVVVCYIGMYGMLISYTLLQFGILLGSRRYISRDMLFLLAFISLVVVWSYSML